MRITPSFVLTNMIPTLTPAASVLPAWIKLIPATSYPKYALTRLEYIAPENSINNGSTNIYVLALDQKGNYVANVKFWQQWPDDRASDVTKPYALAPTFNGTKYGTTFYMSGDSSFDPNKGQSGPYSIYPDIIGDRVNGLGLPLKRHVQYLLTYQWNDNPNPPPVDSVWTITEQSAIRIVLELIKPQ